MDIDVCKLMPIDNLSDYKAHFAVANEWEQPLDAFVRNPEDWKGWNSWHGGRNRFSRRFIFSLMDYYPQPGQWLFGGIFEVIERNMDSQRYGINLVNLYQEYIGRLVLHNSSDLSRTREVYLEHHFHNLTVTQILEKPFQGEAFCGYENVAHGFSQLEAIFKQNKPDWKTALENVKGIYLITDKANGKKYVGSAYGDSGIWSRWANYMGNGHGGNAQLMEVINESGIEYAHANFQFSILEFRSMRTSDETLIARETYWKQVLQSNPHGYNRN